MLQKEGQVRIPAGCAISGIFHKDGTRENGTRIIDSIRTIVPTAWAAASPATASTLNTPITMRSMYSMIRRRLRKSASARSSVTLTL